MTVTTSDNMAEINKKKKKKEKTKNKTKKKTKTKKQKQNKTNTSLKAYSLMSNRGRSQHFQNLFFFFAYFRSPPLRSTIPQRN